MRLTLAAPVISADGETVGTVDQLVLDVNTYEVVKFILRTGHFAHHDRIVPLSAIAREDDDNTIHLTLTADRVRALPELVNESFVVFSDPEETLWRYLIPTPMGGVAVPSVPSGPVIEGAQHVDPASESAFAVKDLTGTVVEARTNLPEFDIHTGKGTKVATSDNHNIGTLHEVDIAADGKAQALVVATGLLHRRHLTVPMEFVHFAGSKQIVLNLTKDEFEKVAALPARNALAPSGAHA